MNDFNPGYKKSKNPTLPWSIPGSNYPDLSARSIIRSTSIYYSTKIEQWLAIIEDLELIFEQIMWQEHHNYFIMVSSVGRNCVYLVVHEIFAEIVLRAQHWTVLFMVS